MDTWVTPLGGSQLADNPWQTILGGRPLVDSLAVPPFWYPLVGLPALDRPRSPSSADLHCVAPLVARPLGGPLGATPALETPGTPSGTPLGEPTWWTPGDPPRRTHFGVFNPPSEGFPRVFYYKKPFSPGVFLYCPLRRKRGEAWIFYFIQSGKTPPKAL